ncbi:MAG: phosphoenolpyruvate carboxykinase (GTP) [Bdellovibrionales bacterium]|nr:phosphoenolpyruvate carboxykinase (GTP) [Bdellovibrionales bacterium]
MSCSNQNVRTWVEEVAKRLTPDRIVWIDGSQKEYDGLCKQLVEDGTFTKLNADKYPNSYWARSNPNDVARVEDRTFICANSKEDAGPTNIWCDPKEMYSKLDGLMKGCMAGRTMYVVPYLMGPDGSPFSKVGFELTDSAYVVANMRIMARIGNVALKNLADDSKDFVRGIHSKGTLDPENRYICHFPQDNTIISFNSDYGGNALQGKKCFALRIASALARKEGWMAEHMLILGITNPKGEKHYVCAAFPSACGKTNLAMLIPPAAYEKAGWKIETVGDDIAWLNFGADGRLYAINPEFGFFGVAPGTSDDTNPNAMATIRKGNTIFTNTALDLDNLTPWWEGIGEEAGRLRDWLGNDWDSESGTRAAHPNSRFTTPASQCPSISEQWESPNGVPISAIIFGGRRARVAPLVYEARDWEHGTFIGATMGSEKTAAAAGKVGELRRDPMAMKPFIGYHAGDYFQHWIDMGKKGGSKMPKIFCVNWFRTDADGKFLWPGFGENIRVLEWVLGRVTGTTDAQESPIGYLPKPGAIKLSGSPVTSEVLEQLLEVDPKDWEQELKTQEEFLASIGNKLPKELWNQHEVLKRELFSAATNSGSGVTQNVVVHM